MKSQSKTLVGIVILALLMIVVVASLCYFSKRRLNLAVDYLKGHFGETVGMIYESEDSGVQTISGLDYSHNQIYWVYSDNLLATWALKPFEPGISSKINQTVQSYSIPPSRFFEVLFGQPIPTNISTAVQLVIEQYADRIIMAEFHNSSTPLLWENYGDTLVYQSLNSFLRGNRTGAEYCFYKAYRMWDGKGIYDHAAQTEGKYANFKLALILYASRILSLTIGNFTRIEETMWSMQQANGGVTSLADLNGNPTGSANTETTAIALLPYNDELIQKMRSLFGARANQVEALVVFPHRSAVLHISEPTVPILKAVELATFVKTMKPDIMYSPQDVALIGKEIMRQSGR